MSDVKLNEVDLSELTIEQLLSGIEFTDLGKDHYFTTIEDNDGVWVGIHQYHRDSETNDWCSGAVGFDMPENADREKTWTVVSRNPLTLSPEIRCRKCGDYGFILGGEWVYSI